ncbi:hypothetical protein RGU12_01585 [Fredinandcohnia sp. QZ13]|uniref:hypothetical protein n=1 Tax=Fredinandcohnia sp. QZ13 TaxID=3073144 RepID=UPI0028533CC0|nr:hypothetical protein [Fredinandcohnia sp. QZ13]MDR4886237.1 hypothetical protein [Fredinandcohnia sp. QZ13]
MANKLPHVEDSASTTYLPPKGEYESFVDEAHYEEKVREWGLSVKKEYWYKERTHQRIVTIKGYEVYGKTQEHNTIVLEFEDGNVTCIHPAYLKEMQSPSFAKSAISDTAVVKEKKKETASTSNVENPASAESKTGVKKEQPTKQIKKEKAPKIELPIDKVHFTATVKQFALTWNHFNEDNDEVVVLEDVVIQQEDPIQIGLAWCSHSKTLKKLELEPGNALEFDAKIVKKKLAKGKDVDEEFIIEDPVHYKINNPSKLKKS